MASDGEQQQKQQEQAQAQKQEPKPETFLEEIFGKAIPRDQVWVKRWLALPLTLRVVALTGGFAAVLFLPYLGAVGLWDPWETHYGEVARMMVVRRDYVFPWWENAWFFSKPPLTMWLQAAGMQVVGALQGVGELGRYTEWGMRMPFALLSITAVALLSLAVARVVSLRAGLATCFVLATMPLYFLLTRQTVTDTPFVTTMMCAMACALIGQLDDTTKHRSAWWYGFYVFLGLSVLAKGLLGALPAAFLLLYAVLCVLPWTWDAWREHMQWLLKRSFRKEVREGKRPMPVLWGQLFRMRLGTGFLVFCAVAVPWYLTLSLFDGVDDEGKGFFYRFFIHDHLNRLTEGVHTTTPGGTFIYFIEQGGYAIFPWVALLPGAFSIVSRVRLRSASKADHMAVLGALWVAFSFWLLASSATKFHHYVFPILPGLAILIALFVDRLWQDGPAAHAVSLLFGLVLFILVGKDLAENPKDFTDLFVYNYDRPYPTELVTKPLLMFYGRALWMGDLVAALMLTLGLFLAVDAFIPSKEAKAKAAEAKAAEAKAAEAKAAEAKAAEVKPAEAQAVEAKVVEPNVVEPNVVEPNVVEPNVVEPNVAEAKVAETSAAVAQPAVAQAAAVAPAQAAEVKEAATQEAQATQAQATQAQATPAPGTPAPGTPAPGTPAQGPQAKKDEEAPTTARTGAVLVLLGGGALTWSMMSSGNVSAMGLFGVALAVVGVFDLWQVFRYKKGHRIGGLIMAAGWLLLGGFLAWRGFGQPVGTDVVLRLMMESVNVRRGLGFAFTVGGALSVVAALKQNRVMVFSVFWVFAFCFAMWFNWNHWVSLSHHWTQRDLFWRYWRLHKPGEPIAAFMMNWRGETFYSRNQVEQFRAGDSNMRMRNFAAQPGREWVLVEHSRLGVLTSAVGADKRINIVERDINNKFILVTVD